MNENKTNFFCIPAFSFIPNKYNELVKNKAGKIFGALFVLFIVLGIVTAIKFNFSINSFANDFASECPDFKLANGEFSIAHNYSFIEDGMYMVIDDSITGIDENYIKDLVFDNFGSQIFVIGKDSFGVYSNNQIQAYKYSDLGNISFSKDTVINEVIPTFKPVIFAAIVVFYMIYIGFYYLAALIMSLFTKILCSIFKKDIDSKYRFRMTLLTKLPVFIISFVIELFTTLSINIWVGAILVIIYTAVVVKLYEDDNDAYVAIEDNNYNDVV